jgi:DNA ligase-1
MGLNSQLAWAAQRRISMNEHEILEKIRNAKIKEKRKIMADNPEIKKIFKYAYDPFLKYRIPIEKVDNFFDSCGHYGKESWWHIFITLDKIINGKVRDNNAFLEITEQMRRTTKENANIILRILNKDLEVGVNRKTVEKVWPNLLSWTEDGKAKIPIMLCKPFEEKRLKFPCLVSTKLDGVRARYIYKKLYTRQGKIIKGMDHILESLKGFKGSLDGELIIPNMKFDVASGLIRSDAQTPNAVYYVFDCPSAQGDKFGRCKFLSEQFKTLYCVFFISHHKKYSYDAISEYYERMIKAGYEGIVICSSNSLYEDKRSWNWMKWVPKLTIDLRCINFLEGTGKNKGKLGAIVVENKGVKIRVGTGFSDFGRQEIWDNPSKYLNKTAEIEYKEISKNGALRMPRFKCWRWDK